MADYHWPPTDKCNLIGRRISRLDGPWKSSGRIKYSYDVNRPNMLHGKMVFSPHAHAKVVSIDTSAAEKMPGVKAVEIMTEPGKEVFWEGHEVVAVAAETEEQVSRGQQYARTVFNSRSSDICSPANSRARRGSRHSSSLRKASASRFGRCPRQGWRTHKTTRRTDRWQSRPDAAAGRSRQRRRVWLPGDYPLLSRSPRPGGGMGWRRTHLVCFNSKRQWNPW